MVSTNEDAWAKVPMWGALGYALLLAFTLPRADHPVSTAVWLLLPSVIAVGLVVIVATQSSRQWAWRAYALTVPTTVVVLAVGLALVRDADPASQEETATAEPRSVAEVAGTDTSTADDRREAAGTAGRPRLTAPPTVQGWTRVDTEPVRSAVRNVADSVERRYGLGTVSGLYRHESGPATGVLYVGVNGRIDQGSPEEVGRAAVAGTGLDVRAFPVPGDGWLGCSAPPSAAAQNGVSCAWVAERWAILMRWEDDAVTIGQAATLTRAFRTFASS